MNRRHRDPGHDLDERALRGVRRRLTVLVTGLLCALLLVLGTSVYVTMHEALLQPARGAIQARAMAQTDHLLELERGSVERSEAPDEQERGGVFIAYATAGLRYLGGT